MSSAPAGSSSSFSGSDSNSKRSFVSETVSSTSSNGTSVHGSSAAVSVLSSASFPSLGLRISATLSVTKPFADSNPFFALVPSPAKKPFTFARSIAGFDLASSKACSSAGTAAFSTASVSAGSSALTGSSSLPASSSFPESRKPNAANSGLDGFACFPDFAAFSGCSASAFTGFASGADSRTASRADSFTVSSVFT